MSQGTTSEAHPATHAGDDSPAQSAKHTGESRLVSARDQPVELSGMNRTYLASLRA